ncbi:hypothetical protein RZS08_58970, partial [Arthrospira platensis SPKY1]|nr:hypothetical protein [Arthrospira platensis SPKY1]
TSSELKTYHTFNELNLWEEPFIVNKNKIKEDIKEENNILIIDKNNIIYEKINDEIIYHEDLKIKLNNKNYLDVDNIYGILKDYNTFLVGPTEELQLDTLIKDRLDR